MSGHPEPPSLLHRFVMMGIAVFAGSLALFEGVALIRAILPWLVVIGGGIAVVWIGVVVFKTWRDRF